MKLFFQTFDDNDLAIDKFVIVTNSMWLKISDVN